MINQSAQRNILPLAPRTVIDAFLVRGTGKMLVQARQSVEAPGAKVAPVARTVPRCRAGDVSACGTFVVPSDALVGKDVARVDFAAVLVDFGAVDAGCAAAGFEVQADAGEVCEFVGTPGTFDVFADVGG